MACGTPVLAEANPMMEELIKPGVNGALWRGDPESLAQAILTLLQKPDQLKAWGLSSKTAATTNLPSAALPKSIGKTFKKTSFLFLKESKHKYRRNIDKNKKAAKNQLRDENQ